MKRRHVGRSIVMGLFLLFTVALPSSAYADGGIIIDDPVLWAQVEEGAQIAVVRLGEGDTAQVNLFISLYDASGESHEVTFFVPLGAQPTAFDAVEEDLYDFERLHISELDDRLAEAASDSIYKLDVQISLVPGLLLVHGVVASPFLCCHLFVGGPKGTEPAATFETEHSIIELYDIDTETDLVALATTTGLDPAVQETLRRLEGQQIAVVKLQTQPIRRGDEGEAEDEYIDPDNQRGLHLSWTAGLVSGADGETYSYPLGTGGAWARPIDETRVYVVAPPGVDFHVTYPRLGQDRSGYAFGRAHTMHQTDSPAYAVSQAVGDFGRIWRAIYVQSNAVEDIVITRVEGLLPQTRAVLRHHAFQLWVMRLTWVIGLLAALVIWVTAWRFVMSRQLGFSYSHWFDWRLWRQAAGWMAVYVGSSASIIPLYAYFLLILTNGEDSFLPWFVLLLLSVPVLASSLGIVSGFLFARNASHKKGVPRRKAAGAYASVAILSIIGYGLFALVYLALVGGL